MNCPKCGSKRYYLAFHLNGDINWCLDCNYQVFVDSGIENKGDILDLE